MNPTTYIFLLLVLLFNGCKPEGCMNPKAGNYEPKAKKDNHSCVFTTRVVFWIDEKTSKKIVEDGAISLKFYVNGVFAGSSAADVYWPGAPNCGQTGAVTTEIELSEASQKIALPGDRQL